MTDNYDIEELRHLLKINRNHLDEALMDQADIYYHVSSEYATAVSQRDQAYEQIKQVDAGVELGIREEAENEGRKITEKTVNSLVLESKEHKDAFTRYVELKERTERLQALKDAFQQRSYMLREMVQLYIAGFFVNESGKTTQSRKEEIEYEKSRGKMAEKRKATRNKRREDAAA